MPKIGIIITITNIHVFSTRGPWATSLTRETYFQAMNKLEQSNDYTNRFKKMLLFPFGKGHGPSFEQT